MSAESLSTSILSYRSDFPSLLMEMETFFLCTLCTYKSVAISRYSCARKFGHPCTAATLLVISPDVYNLASCQLLLR